MIAHITKKAQTIISSSYKETNTIIKITCNKIKSFTNQTHPTKPSNHTKQNIGMNKNNIKMNFVPELKSTNFLLVYNVFF